ncbi:ubiquitin fusion degradation protein UFD1-domain-containing protein [Radiomyces spectabilis]|uniref:ubiquitin fusion degradation protein UFD1-domain-containing protein n=1 Tax=Radiomyces spectabilis TaxID=64574 RepID=UPI00221FCC9D|nr:ubiquitin fusion degradation protein UFD1-domain-containing protein [Radiomyces spectabilis]KAI8391224.1 ubiquitin fusion degradation protein UFD1-domain-containing protein [Radiomyces spectabilis]
MITWTKVFHVQPSPSHLEEGDKIILPSQSLEQLLQAAPGGSLPSPLTFELRHPHTGAMLHGGVKEFSGNDADIVQLPAWMMNALDLKANDRIMIKARDLPKGTWVRLRPLSSNYTDIVDYRAALEAHLRSHYNTLTTGQTLICRYGSQLYRFTVLELKPEAAVCITDTDLEVDLEPLPKELSTDENNFFSQSEVSVASVDQPIVSVAVSQGESKHWQLKQGAAIRVVVESGDLDVLLSDRPNPTLENHLWSDLSSDSERYISLQDKGMGSNASSVYITFHGYTDSVFTWECLSTPNDDQQPQLQTDQPSETAPQEGFVQCHHCKAWLPERTLMLHEGFCLRNNIVCSQGCGRVFKRDSDEARHHWHCPLCSKVGQIEDEPKHMAYYHAEKVCSCSHCTTDSYEKLAAHRRTSCPERLITCRYCHKCQRQIPIKDIQVHAKIHEVHRQNQKLPPLCSNKNCTRPRANNRLRLCQYCFGPFWVSEDDPKNMKLIQRVARKLHSQLTVGCEKSWCGNKFCATATKDPKDATTAASMLIPMIQSLQRELTSVHPKPELYFCVDEATSRKHFLADILVDNNANRFGIDWCIKALETENEDLDLAQRWLEANAPRLHNDRHKNQNA